MLTDGPTCLGKSCLDPVLFRSDLGDCSEFVNYPFCVSNFSTPAHVNTSAWSTEVTRQKIRDRASEAKNCLSGTDWDASSDCGQAVKKGGCLLAFPHCTVEAGAITAHGICSAHCAHERSVCRQLGSQLGPKNYIELLCSEAPWDSTSQCTGAGSQLMPRSSGPLLLLSMMTAAVTLLVLPWLEI